MPSPATKPFDVVFNAATDEPAKMYIYSAIGESFWGESVSATSILKELAKVPATKALNVYINSPGGSVYDGMSIHNQLKRHKGKVTCYIDGMCASIATAIALGGEKVIMASNGTFMVHEPACFTSGDIKTHTTAIGRLTAAREGILNTYEAKTGTDRAELESAMSVETWYTAKEALAAGFIDSIGEPVEMTNSFDLSAYKHAPVALQAEAVKACSDSAVEGKLEEVHVVQPKEESPLMTTEATTQAPAAVDLSAAVEAGITKRLLDNEKATVTASLQAARLAAVSAMAITPAVAEALELGIVKDIQNAGSATELNVITARVKAVFQVPEKAGVVETVTTPSASAGGEDTKEFKFTGDFPSIVNGCDQARQAYVADLFAKHLVAEGKFDKYETAAYAVYEQPLLYNQLLKLAPVSK